MDQNAILLDTPTMDTAKASAVLGLNGRACLDKRRLRGTGPAYTTIGKSGPGRKRRVLYSLRNLIDYAKNINREKSI